MRTSRLFPHSYHGIIRLLGLLAIGLLLLVGAGCKQMAAPPSDIDHPPAGIDNGGVPAPGEPSASKNVKEAPRSYSATIAAIGDVLIHGSIYKDAKTSDGYDFKPMLAPVKSYLEQADVTIANQESMLGGVELGLSDYPQFNSPSEVADALKDAGIDVVNLANNHTLDRGVAAIERTIQRFRELNVLYTGAYLSAEDRNQLRTMEKNGISFAFLSYTYGTNGIRVPADKPYLVNLIDLPLIRKEVAEAAKQADAVIVSFHFGQEYVNLPNEEQKQIARAAAEAGAAVVIGHHPHVLQPPAWIETTDGRRVFVAYSLGNFIAAQEGDRRRIGGVLNLRIEKTVQNGLSRIEVKEPSFLPTWIHRVNWRQYKVYPLVQAPKSQLSDAKATWREIAAHLRHWMPELEVLEE